MTILDHYYSVVDENLRDELLRNYDETHKEFPLYKNSKKRLCDAIDFGFNWRKTGKQFYWEEMFEKALYHEIETSTVTEYYKNRFINPATK